MDSLKRYLTACCPCFGLAEPVSVESVAEPVSVESVCLQVGGRSFDLNEASQADLESLPGIGPSKAAAIVLHREKHGRFLSVDGLLAVSGIGAATVAKVRGLVRSSADARAPDRPIVPPPPPPPNPVPAVRAGDHAVYFFPDGPQPGGLTVLLHALAGARATLDVAMYAISLEPLAAALRDARARGVRVRVLSDDEQAREAKSAVPHLVAEGVPVRTDRSVKFHLHHKFCLVDGGPLLAPGFLRMTHPDPDPDPDF